MAAVLAGGKEQGRSDPIRTAPRVEPGARAAPIRHPHQGMAQLQAAIKKQGPQLPGYESLKSIKGIGDSALLPLACNYQTSG